MDEVTFKPNDRVTCPKLCCNHSVFMDQIGISMVSSIFIDNIDNIDSLEVWYPNVYNVSFIV